MNDDAMNEIVQEFLVETSENLDQLDQDLVALESDPHSRELGKGFDIPLLRRVCAAVRVPVVASGGVGELGHFVAGAEAGATGLLAASVFHFGTFRIEEVKDALAAAGFPVRKPRVLA